MWCSVPPETPYENDSSRIIPAGLVVLHIHAVRHMNSLLCCTQCSNYIQNLTWTIYCPEFCHMKHRSWTESSKTTVLRFMRVYFSYCEKECPLMTYSSLHSDLFYLFLAGGLGCSVGGCRGCWGKKMQCTKIDSWKTRPNSPLRWTIGHCCSASSSKLMM